MLVRRRSQTWFKIYKLYFLQLMLNSFKPNNKSNPPTSPNRVIVQVIPITLCFKDHKFKTNERYISYYMLKSDLINYNFYWWMKFHIFGGEEKIPISNATIILYSATCHITFCIHKILGKTELRAWNATLKWFFINTMLKQTCQLLNLTGKALHLQLVLLHNHWILLIRVMVTSSQGSMRMFYIGLLCSRSYSNCYIA